MEAKKSLGQHFLINTIAAERIASFFKNEKCVIEIGGGRGALTKKLLTLRKPKVLVIEIDSDMVVFLENIFGKDRGFYLIKGDGREIKVRKNCSVCGNLPYNMAKNIIKNFILQKEYIDKMVFMVQKEVAETITSKSGKRTFNKFSVLCQMYYNTRKVFDLKPGSFSPRPKVESSVVEFKRKTNVNGVDKSFFDFLERLFSHPRKKVKNNLKIDLDNNISNKRPSDLTIDEIYTIWRAKWQTQ